MVHVVKSIKNEDAKIQGFWAMLPVTAAKRAAF